MASASERELINSLVIRLLREERERQGISMTRLAEKSGISQSTVSLIERELRNPTLDTLLRIADVLKIELGQILLNASATARQGGFSKPAKNR
jgi:transcriptional regulator with XRE-family HTH domain